MVLKEYAKINFMKSKTPRYIFVYIMYCVTQPMGFTFKYCA